MHDNFQASSYTGVGGGGGDERKDGHHTILLNVFPCSLLSDNSQPNSVPYKN